MRQDVDIFDQKYGFILRKSPENADGEVEENSREFKKIQEKLDCFGGLGKRKCRTEWRNLDLQKYV